MVSMRIHVHTFSSNLFFANHLLCGGMIGFFLGETGLHNVAGPFGFITMIMKS